MISLSGLISNWARPRNWERLSVCVDIAAPGQRINLMPKRQGELPGIAFGVGLTVLGISEAIGNHGDLASLMFPALFIAGGSSLFAASLISAFSKREAVFGNEAVEVSGHSLLGIEKWREPFSKFKGVLHREKSVGGGENRATKIYQIIELEHDDPKKNIPLMVEESGTMPRDAWEAYAKWLHLPAMMTIAGETTTRDLEDLDKSIAELAADGKIATRLDFSNAPPPKGLLVARETIGNEECLRVAITAPRAHIALRLLVCGIPMCFFLTLVFFGLIASITLMTILGGLGAIVIVMIGIEWSKRDKRARRDILITRKSMQVTDPWQKWPDHQKSFELSEIETITRQSRGGGIMIAGDKARVDIGAGLSKAALIWLRDYLTSAVATA